MEWHWPQYALATLYTLAALGSGLIHGKPKSGEYSAPATWISVGSMIYILHRGGFW